MDDQEREIQRLRTELDRERARKSPEVAWLLALTVPGSGHFYARDGYSGCAAVCWTAIAGACVLATEGPLRWASAAALAFLWIGQAAHAYLWVRRNG